MVRKKYGMSFQQMLYRTRVLAASRLLLSTGMTPEGVGASVGFRSERIFKNAFRKVFGMTPLRYQRMSANETKRPQTDEILSVVIREEETKCLS